jgi:hypothetical protein
MATDGNEIKQFLSNKYYCKFCDYGTCRKSNMDNHCNSNKHIMATDGHTIKQNLSNQYVCENCNKIYKDRTGLWKHNKKCNKQIIPTML